MIQLKLYYSNNTVLFFKDEAMISFENLPLEEGTPIYLQIIRYVKGGIAAGRITDQEEMPSRRVLSALLGVNPNTVQKAYRLLEEEGVIQSHAGAKSLTVVNPRQVLRLRQELLISDTRKAIRSMKQIGVSKAEALALMDTLWDKEEE